MKKVLLFAALLTATISVQAQCNEIFISEYVEGTFNNKAIEIYNPTDAAIDLSGYQLERFSNGSNNADANQRLVLSGTVEPHDVYVYVIDKRDPDGTGTETPVWEGLQDQADEFVCPVYAENNTLYINGNDALVLRKLSNNSVIDLFGKVGEDPADDFGGGWNNIPPSYVSSINGGVPWTEDHTMIRKASVEAGVTTNPDAFNTELQWDTVPANTFVNLGAHVSVCDPDNVGETTAAEISLYPNPSQGWFVVSSSAPIIRVEIFDLSGKKVYSEEVANPENALRISADLPKGVYVMKGLLEDNRAIHSKMVVR